MEKHYFDWPVRVYYEDTDCARVVYYANYFRFIKKPARLDDELVVRSTVTACGRTSFEFHQEILRGDEVLNVGDVRCGTLDAHTFRPMAMPEPISEQLKKLLNH